MRDGWLYAWGLGSVAFGGASLLIPLYAVGLGASPVDLGILASTAAVIGAPGAILFGRLANDVGHRRLLVVVTLVTVGLALAVVPLLTSVATVIVANAALWLVSASVAPVLTMLVVDGAPEGTWTERIGRLNTYQGYGWAGGLVLGTVWPLVGGQIFDPTEATRTLFWVLALCAGASAVGAARTLPRPAPGAGVTDGRDARRIARILARSRRGVKGATFAFSPNRLFWTTRQLRPRRIAARLTPTLAIYLVAAGLFFTGFAAFWAPLPLFLTETGFGSGQVFALYLVSSLGSAVLYDWAGTLATRYDVRVLQSAALGGRGVLFPLVALVPVIGAVPLELGTAGVALVLIGATWAVIAVVGTVIVTRLAPASIRGEILGVHTALGAIAGGVGGVLGGWAATFGYAVAFAVAGGLVVLGGVLVLTLRGITGATRSPSTGDALDRDR
ncbi:hypothetical protein GCM10028857_17960 [Salinarchaeum chitinilyticum]